MPPVFLRRFSVCPSPLDSKAILLYYNYRMVTFDGAETDRAIKNRRICNGLNVMYITLIAVAAVALAALSSRAEKFWGVYIGGLAAFGVLIAVYIVNIFTAFRPAGRELNRLICSAIASGFSEDEAILKGGGDIAFTANYSGNELELKREGFTGEIKLSAARVKEGENIASAGAAVRFDLTPLKAVPAEYGTVGTKLWLFLQAYYYLHAQEHGCESVTVTDNTGKTPLKLTIVADGKCTQPADKNYFIVKGLIT